MYFNSIDALPAGKFGHILIQLRTDSLPSSLIGYTEITYSSKVPG